MAYELKNKSGENIKHQGVNVLAADITNVLVKDVDLGERTLLLIGTDETRDRDGDILTYTGWKFENFYKNPVFLWAHDYSSVPLARTMKIIKRPKQKRYDFNMKFPTSGINPFADMILALYYEKIINASSVGFIPEKSEDIEDKDDGKEFYSNRRFLEKELLELSGCAVPCNPSAVQEMDKFLKNSNFSGVKAIDLFAEFKKGNIPGLKLDDVLKELEVKEVELIGKDRKKFYNAKPDDGFKTFVVEEMEPKEDAPGFKEVEKEDDKKGIKEINKIFPPGISCFDVDIDGLSENELKSLIGDQKRIIDIFVNKNYKNPSVKSGAVLNKKNLALLTEAIENIQKVLDSAKREEEEEDKLREPERPPKEENTGDKTSEPKANTVQVPVSIYDSIFEEVSPNKEQKSAQIPKNQTDILILTEELKKLAEVIKSF